MMRMAGATIRRNPRVRPGSRTAAGRSIKTLSNANIAPTASQGDGGRFSLTLVAPKSHAERPKVSVGCKAQWERLAPRTMPRLGGADDPGRRALDSMAKVMVVDDAYSELKLMESILKSA